MVKLDLGSPTPQIPLAKSKRIKGFDGIRTLAVFLVILAHNFYHKFNVASGGSGVRLFFVLSGFLIISILARRRIEIENGRTTIKSEIIHFFENRVFRIWPIYFATLLVSCLAASKLYDKPIDAPSWIANALFIGNIMVGYIWLEWRQVGIFWSVGVEEQFYLWAGLALLLASSRRHVAICCGAILFAVIAAMATTFIIPSPKLAKFSIDLGSFTNFGMIALGGVAALVSRKNRFINYVTFPFLLIYILFSLIGWPIWMTGALFLIPSVIVAVVLSGIFHNQDTSLVKILEWPPISYLGKISYGIYLFHTIVRFDLLMIPTWFDSHATVKALVETLLAIGLAALSWQYFEKPILNYRDQRRKRQYEANLEKSVFVKM